jgi:ATP-dependent DNA helicase RecQ
LGELTVVVSPLKALMKDQMDNLNRVTGMESAAAINGSLTLPERGAVMEKVRLGDVGLLYVSPEQLRNKSVADLIKTRDVGYWVFDEAHCLSKWGHDFRPDYLHITEFISNYCKECGMEPLVGAFTATAKKDVIEEIRGHFTETLGMDLTCYIGGVQRDNLNFQVWPVTKNEKYDVVAGCLAENLKEAGGGAIVYCSTQKNAETLSGFLNEKGIPSQAFHAGRSEPDKRNIQDDFLAGKIPVICATNAFGMGIDKKDIRLVIHADTPGSLENYLQEAGRAGRDLEPSDCILLYEQEDIENQFSLNAYSRLSFKDIRKILAILKKRGADTPDIVITPGEIMRLIGYTDSPGDDNRARVGVSWLERKGFVERSFNQTLFFTGTPLVRDMDEAGQKIDALNFSKIRKAVYLTVIGTLFNADKGTVLSADEICSALGKIENLPEDYLDSRNVIRLLNEMAESGLIREGIVMTAYVRPRGKGNSHALLADFSNMETRMIGIMEEMSPDACLSPETPDVINLRLMSQRLKDKGFDNIHSGTVEEILRAMAADKGENQGKSLKISGKQGLEQQRVFVKFPWEEIRKRAGLRHNAARVCLDAIVAALPPHLRTGQAQVMSEFFMSDMIKAMDSDLFLAGLTFDRTALIEQCLLYLHDLKIITLQNGLGVFRQALTLSLCPESRNRRYTQGDYEPLSHHYAQKNVQVHVMEKYARLGLEKIKTALVFVSDYFSSSYENFVNRYFQDQKKIIETAMTEDAYKRIVQSLENTIQETVVAAPPEKNILVLAGPGSGKTKTIVHRCAWLIKARSTDPSSILVLCFNHQAMIELRKRIKALAGSRADGVTAMTYHGFAMRLTGRSLVESAAGNPLIHFDGLIDEAVDILEGKREIQGVDAMETRDHLLSRYRYILVDEYQDIDARQYRFISALTGRLEKDKDAKIAIMAVGDDDQSIYGFRHANVAFIKQFQEDYKAETHYLVENYRSTRPIIEAANALVALNRDRMKTDRPCRIDRKRKSAEKNPRKMPQDALVQRVHVWDTPTQAVWAAGTIQKILQDRPDVEPGDIAVVSRHGISHPYLVALRMALARENIPFCYSLKSDSGFPMTRIREIQDAVNYLAGHKTESRNPRELKKEIMGRFAVRNTWTNLVEQTLDAWQRITPDMEISLARALDFVMETLAEERREQKTGNGVFLGTVHSVKGMEFPYVFILDGGWTRKDIEEERRLYYVGMTRAKESLFLCRMADSANPHVMALAGHPMVHDTTAPASTLVNYSDGLTVSILGLEDLYISFAGKFPKNHPIHRHLAELETGDPVTLEEKEGTIRIIDAAGRPLAKLSSKASEKWSGKTHFAMKARALGIVRRHTTDGEARKDYPTLVDTWEIPIVEVLHKKQEEKT